MSGAELSIKPKTVFGFVIVFSGTLALGGLVAYLIGDASAPRDAIFYGLGWQGVLGGFIQGGRAEIAEAKLRG
jgi:hypothetical protein